MQKQFVKTRKSILLVAGSLLILIATFIIASPAEFYASNQIDLGANVSLLNELKAPAGFLLAAGAFMLIAVFVNSLLDTAVLLGTMIYLSYAVARFASMGLDGMPASGLVQAAALEAVIGLACLGALLVVKLPARRTA